MNSIIAISKIEDVYSVVTGYRTNGRHRHDEIRVLCPVEVHSKSGASCDLNTQKKSWHCQACGRGGGVIDLILESGYLSPRLVGKERLRAAYELLERITNFDPPERDLQDQPAYSNDGRKVVTVYSRTFYPFIDLAGNVRYEEVRIEGLGADGKYAKDIYGRVPLPPGTWSQRADGVWIMHDSTGHPVHIDGNLLELSPLTSDGTPRQRLPKNHLYSLRFSERIPYRLPQLVEGIAAGRTIFVTEGSKKCNVLVERSGLCVTTWYGGANEDPEPSWEPIFARAKRIVVLGDDDDAGRAATARRCDYFVLAGAKAVTALFFAQNGEGYDVEDWLTARQHLTKKVVIEEIRSLIQHRPWRIAA